MAVKSKLFNNNNREILLPLLVTTHVTINYESVWKASGSCYWEGISNFHKPSSFNSWLSIQHLKVETAREVIFQFDVTVLGVSLQISEGATAQSVMEFWPYDEQLLHYSDDTTVPASDKTATIRQRRTVCFSLEHAADDEEIFDNIVSSNQLSDFTVQAHSSSSSHSERIVSTSR